MHEFLKYAFMPSTVKRAAKVALVITSILTFLNHFREIQEMRFSGEFWLQVGLTFIVPYSVSTFSSAQAARQEHEKQTAEFALSAGHTAMQREHPPAL